MIGFYKRMWDLVSRNENPSPPVAQSLTQDEIGRAYGGQVLLRQELVHGFFGWITYSLTRSERTRPPRHRLAPVRLRSDAGAGARGQLPARPRLGRRRALPLHDRLPAHAGHRRLPTTSANDQYEPIFGAHNSIRIPSFYQLDARVEKSFVYRRVKFNVFLDVQNVTNRQNPEEIIYNYNFTLTRLHHRLPDAGGARRAGGVLMKRRPGFILAALAALDLAGGRLQAESRRAAVAHHRPRYPGRARDAARGGRGRHGHLRRAGRRTRRAPSRRPSSDWAQCLQPNPPANGNDVSINCLPAAGLTVGDHARRHHRGRGDASRRARRERLHAVRSRDAARR